MVQYLQKIPPSVCRLIDGFHESGFEAYIVGGCVRDLLCGNTPSDWDVATNASPEQITAVFRTAIAIINSVRLRLEWDNWRLPIIWKSKLLRIELSPNIPISGTQTRWNGRTILTTISLVVILR